MAVFPISPSANDTTTIGGTTYIYTGVAWRVVTGNVAITTFAATPHSNPDLGDFWYNTTSNILYMRVEDAASTDLWLDISTAGGEGMWNATPELASLDGSMALKKRSSSPTATADYAKIYSKDVPNPSDSDGLYHLDNTYSDAAGGPDIVTPGAVDPTFDSSTGNYKHGTHSMKITADNGSGVGSLAIIPSSLALQIGTGIFTIDFWVKMGAGANGAEGTSSKWLFMTDLSDNAYGSNTATSSPNLQMLYIQGNNTVANYPDANKIYFYVAKSGGTGYWFTQVATGLSTAAWQAWNHIAIVRESVGGEVDIYINGVRKAVSASTSTGPLFTQTNNGSILPGLAFGYRPIIGTAYSAYTYTSADMWIDEFNISNGTALWSYPSDDGFTPPGPYTIGSIAELFAMDGDGNETKLT